jgi:chorismate synthase
MLTRLKFLTAGESHGQGLLGILDGMPAGLKISEEYIGVHLARRQMGHGRGGRMKIEKDYAEIWCGVATDKRKVRLLDSLSVIKIGKTGQRKCPYHRWKMRSEK